MSRSLRFSGRLVTLVQDAVKAALETLPRRSENVLRAPTTSVIVVLTSIGISVVVVTRVDKVNSALAAQALFARVKESA